MDLQLGKQKRMMYARVFDRTEEETCSVDAVVPDALGDIGAIVVAEGTFCLWNLDFSDKSAQIEGSIAADVVYAEEGGALRSFPVELPVKVRISGETLSPDVRPWLRCTLTALDARAVNSRKVRVTARLSLCLHAYRETELALTDRIEGDGGAVFTRTETLRVQIPVSVEEKTFTVSETHRFLSGQPEADRMLCHTETVLLDDVSAAGSRVILQGRVCAAVTYLPQGQICPAVETFETAFSQMLDCPADTSPCLLHTTVNLTAAYLNVSAAADGAALEAEYHLVAQTVCLADAEADCVTDAYCNTAELTLERETVGSLVSALCTMHARQDGASAPRRIPLYRSIEAAGYAAPVPGEDFDYIVDHGDVPPGAEFAVRIRDDSLEPVLHSGSVAYLNHDPLHAGDVGIFCVGGDMLCKQYYRDPLGVSYLFSLGRDRSADVVCGPESGKRFICFGHVILDHRVPLPGMGL